MKLSVIGGCGSRSMMLAKSLASEAIGLGISTVVFMDIDEFRVGIFGPMIKKVFELLAPSVELIYTSDEMEAVKHADFIITTIRVGKEEGRITDERIAIKYGLIGQETTGVGGFAMALRSIPGLLHYCSLIKRYSNPDVMVFNFTNPAGLVTQALHNEGYHFVYGICDAPSGFLRQLSKLYRKEVNDFQVELIGLNHLSFFTGIRCDGKEMLEEILENPDLYTKTDMRYFEPELAKHVGCLLNEYLYYFYYRDKAVSNLMKGDTRGERIRDINYKMLDELKQYHVSRDFEKMLQIYSRYTYMRESNYMENETSIARNSECIPIFDLYSKDEGGYAGVALSLIRAKVTEKTSEMILCIPNGNTLPWLEAEDIIEVSCDISSYGAKAKKADYHVPESAKQLIQLVKFYERNAASAIVHKEKAKAVEALMFHPLINSYSLANQVFDEYAQVYKEYMGDWKL